MSALQELPQGSSSSVGEVDEPKSYHRRISQVLLDSKPVSPADTLLAFEQPVSVYPHWYLNARKVDREYHKDLFQRRWLLQGQLDEFIGTLQQDVRDFSEPLLVKALKDTLNVELDVRTAELRLYVPDKLMLGIDRGAYHFRQMTLLDAALHNFEAAEAEPTAFADGSGVFTRDAEGAPLRHAMTVAQFVTLCRQLDIGAQYQAHLKDVLTPAAAPARVALQQQSMDSDKAVFKLSAMTAYLKGDLTSHAFGLTLQVHDGKPDRQLYGRPMLNHRLSLMGFQLTGITLFSSVGEPAWAKKAVDALSGPLLTSLLDLSQEIPFLPGQEYEQFKLLKAFFANGPKGLSEELARRQDAYTHSRLVGNLIVYIPDDPEHPLREYSSFTDFMKTLIGQLRDPDYQRFFSRFVAQEDKGLFFRRVNERLKTFTWQQRRPLDMGPWWRETAVENPHAEPLTHVIPGNVWNHLYSVRRNKLIADARQIAVPTGDENALSRWKRLTSYLDIGWNVFNFAAMLVPGLGEAMLGIMVAQVLEELAEGIEDWSRGDREEASGHIISVIINGAQLAMMGAGHVLPAGRLTPIRPSPLLDSLQAVELPDGQASLWKPDLAPYEYGMPLPKDVRPNDAGLYQYDDQSVLSLEKKRYRVASDPFSGQYRIEHPARPNAYRPRVTHNGAGAWISELEQPLTWDDAKVWRRLGPSMEALPPATQAQIRTVSGVDATALRRLHVENESPSPLLADTLKRFKVYALAEDFSRQILNSQVSEELERFVPALITELPGWPATRAIELHNGSALPAVPIKYGFVDASATQTIRVSITQLRNGQLLERVLDSLTPGELRELLGTQLSDDRGVRLEALRSRLAMHAERQTRRLFDSLYKTGEQTSEGSLRVLKGEFPALPVSVGQRLLEQASAEDLRFITQKGRLSLRLKAQVRQALAEVRVARAVEGLYLQALASEDTERLALHSIAALPGWSAEVRIEVRELTFNGRLSDSVGPPDASIRKVLLRKEEGTFEARDEQDQHLHGADDLYGALLHALPDGERKALGYEINQGAQLKAVVRQAPMAHDELAPVLRDAPLRKPSYDPQTMKLRGGMQGYRQVPGSASVRHRASHLYPGFSEEELDALMQKFQQKGIALEQQISALEQEFNELNFKFQVWVNTGTLSLRAGARAEWAARNRIYAAFRHCWQRTGPRGLEAIGEDHPQHLELGTHDLARHLPDMPPLTANFDHVTGLGLDANALQDQHTEFLSHFGNLRHLSLRGNLLTTLTPRIAGMRHLTTLLLSNNQIVLTAQSVAWLRGLTHMESLALTGNPLGLLPDISRMPNLSVLQMGRTGVNSWPTGFLLQSRPRHFFLDLRENPISRIPEVAPGSFRAELLARTQISRSSRWISAENLRKFKLYIESMGLDPERPYAPQGPIDSIDWSTGLSEPQWQTRQPGWDGLEDEFGSAWFFNRLKQLTRTADFNAGGAYRADLTTKVWRMIEAMAENAELREKIFTEAVAPTECVDGLTEWFNAMGTEVMIHEAYQLANPDLVKAALVRLAKGKTRLLEIDRIARRHISARLAAGESMRRVDADDDVTGTIDEVEVHLAYMTDLAERLNLPWQSRGMQFRDLAGVTPAMIEDAYQWVLALEEGDLLRNSIAQLPFWKAYAEGSNRQLFKALRRKLETLTDFKIAMDERVNTTDLTPQARERLKERLRVLSAGLGKPDSAIAPGEVMTDDAYDSEYQAGLDDVDQLLKKVTQDAMDLARLERDDAPFTR